MYTFPEESVCPGHSYLNGTGELFIDILSQDNTFQLVTITLWCTLCVQTVLETSLKMHSSVHLTLSAG